VLAISDLRIQAKNGVYWRSALFWHMEKRGICKQTHFQQLSERSVSEQSTLLPDAWSRHTNCFVYR
jgi:hypothetical protein